MKQALNHPNKNLHRANNKQGNTCTSRDQLDEPRLPHERDESADNQMNSNTLSQDKLRKALENVNKGVVDSDKGPVLENLAKHMYPPK